MNYEAMVREYYPSAVDVSGIWVDGVNGKCFPLGKNWRAAWLTIERANKLAERNRELLRKSKELGHRYLQVPRQRFRPSYTR